MHRNRLILLMLGCLFAHGSIADTATSPVYAAEPVEPYPAIQSGGNYLFNYYIPPANSSSPWWVSWAPSGSTLFFAMHGSLWKIDARGGAATELKSSSEYLSSPTASPDGRYLAYTSEVNGERVNLRILDLLTGRDIAVSSDEQVTLDPAWSPDGNRLAFVSTRQDGHLHIYVAELHKGQTRKITSITHVPGSQNEDPVTGRTGTHTSPTWTADGQKLVFVWNRGAEQGSGGLWVMEAVEHGIQQARPIHREESVFRLRPDVSPDGSRIVYSSYAGEQFNNLYLLPLAGGTPYKLSFDQADRFHPRWSPDGRRIAYVSNNGGTSTLRVLDVFSGADVAVNVTERHWLDARGRLTVKTVDATSGEPIAARVYLRAADGKSYAPNDAYHRIARRLGEFYFHSRGEFELDVPSGNVEIEVHRGFEYYPVAKQLSVQAGVDKSVTIALQRMHDSAAQGWYSGDNHVHMNYAGNLRNSPQNLVEMADAEGVSIVNALVANKYTRIIDRQYFTATPHNASTGDTILMFSEEYRPPFYGHLSLLGLQDHLISPFTAGLDGTALESLYPSNTEILQLAGDQQAIGGYVHPFRGPEDPILEDMGGARAFPVDLALGTLGFHELTSQASWGAYRVWHHALSAGFRVPIVGGEDAITDLHRMYVLGQLRTYARVEGRLSWKNWLDAIRRGNTVVTNGPLLTMSVAGSGPGEEQFLDKPGTVIVSGSVKSVVPVDHVEILVNGEALPVCSGTCRRDPNGPGTQIEFEKSIPIERSSWLTLQVHTDNAIHPTDDHFVQATTNAVWVTVDKQPIRRAESILYFRRWIHELIAQLDAPSKWRSDDEKHDVLSRFHAADSVFGKRVLESRAVCPQPMADHGVLVALDRELRSLNEAADNAIRYSVVLEDGCSGTLYSVNGDATIPAASSVKTALLIEFFAEFSERLDLPFEQGKTILSNADSPAFRHFDAQTMQNIRDDLVGLTVREIGEAMISKQHVTSNASYNAAANLVIFALGGPQAVTSKIRDRHPAIRALRISRYMLADRHETGDNVTTLNDLAAIHRRLATRDHAKLSAGTIDATRAVLEIEPSGDARQFYKGGSLSSDPQVRIEAGWLQKNDDILVYAVAANRLSPTGQRTADYAAIRVQVSKLSEIAKEAIRSKSSH